MSKSMFKNDRSSESDSSALMSTSERSAFTLLFEKNVAHILEGIFLSLDYKSFKNCLQVCKQWNQLLSTDHFNLRVREVYSVEMWMGEEDLNIESRDLNLHYWTSNGREVAYITLEDDESKTLHYIDDTGGYNSTELDSKEILNVHILKNVILLICISKKLIGSEHETKLMLLCMMKENLSQSEISLPEPLREKKIEHKFYGMRIKPSIIGPDCVYIALYDDGELDGTMDGTIYGLTYESFSSVWLGRIADDISLEGPKFCTSQEREDLFVDLEKFCYMQKCEKLVNKDFKHRCGFAKDSPYFIACQHDLTGTINITVYKLHKCFAEKLWCKPVEPYKGFFAGNTIIANSKYVFVVAADGGKIYAMDHGEPMKEIPLWKGTPFPCTLVISHKHLAIMRRLNGLGHTELIRLDLETFKVERLMSKSSWFMFAFGGGALIGLTNERTTSIHNLSAAGSLGALNNRRLLNNHNVSCPMYDPNYQEVQEAGKRFVLISPHHELPSSKVTLMSWKSKHLPPALVTFMNKLGFTD